MENKKELPGDVIVEAQRDARIEAELRRQEGLFVTEKLNEKRNKLGEKEFDEQRDELEKKAKQQWDQLQKANAVIRELENQSCIELVEWAPLEKVYRAKLEAEGYSKAIIEKTLEHRRMDFDSAQRRVQERLRPQVNHDQDFKQCILNPKTRREAITRYLQDNISKEHFQVEAFNLIFEELDKLKAK